MNPSKKNNLLPEHERFPFKIIETIDQRASLYDVIRQEIIRVLSKGYEDYSSETKSLQRTLDDGTRITEEIKIEKPFRRYWMTVPEILKALSRNKPDFELGATKAYYHLGKLHEQGLIEQYPETANGKNTRVRGRYYRLVSKFFIEVTVEASVGYSGEAVMPDEIGPRFVDIAEGIRQTGVTDSLEYQVNLDSVLVWVSMTMSRHPDGLNIIAVVRDITTHRTLEERLLKSEVEFGRLVEESFQSYAIFQDNRLVFANPAYAKTVGRSRSELNLMTQEAIREMIHPEDRSILEERTSNFKAGIEIFPRHRFRYVQPDGTIRWVDSFARKTEHLGKPAFLILEIDITEQKRAEEALMRSERRFREIFDSSTIAIGRCDLEGKFVEMNPAYLTLFGIRDTKDASGYRFQSDPHIPQWATDSLSENGSATFDLTYDFDLIRKRNLFKTSKKGTIELVATLVPFNLPEEDPEAGYLVMVQDISERVAAEEALRDNEERYRAFFKQAADSIIVFNPGTMKIIDFNRHAHERLGYTPEEFEKLHMWEIDASGDKAKIESRIMEIAEKGNLVFETKHKMKSGTVIDVRISAILVSYRDKITIQWIITDITELKRIDQTMKASEKRFRAIFDTSIDAIIILKDNKLVDMNATALKIFGCNRGDLIGKTPWSLSPRKQPEGSLSKGVLLKMIDLVLSGEPQLFNWRYRRCDGSDFDAVVGFSALRVSGEDLVQIILRLETDEHLKHVGRIKP